MDDISMAGKAVIPRYRFGAELVGSPAWNESHAMYDTLVAHGLRPEVFLGFFWVESKYGTEGVAKNYNTKNPGNVRTPETNLGTQTPEIPGKGKYATYPSWTSGTKDWCLRIKGPKYQGGGLLTVRQVLPKYAPAHDKNDPIAYGNSVMQMVRRWLTEDKVPQIIDLRGTLPTSKTGGSGRRNPNKRGQVLHYSAVNYPRTRDMLDILKSEAAYHIGPYLKERGIAYHFAVDPYLGDIYQLRDEDEVLWHCGYWGTPGNDDGLAIHVPGGSTLKMEPVAVQALAWLLGRNEQKYGFVRGMFKGHKELSDTSCPGPLMDQVVLPYRAGTLRYNGIVVKTPVVPKEEEVREPAPEQVISYVNSKGETIIAANMGGQAKRVDGYIIKDMGVSIENAEGEMYDRSIQDAAFQPWRGRD